MNVHWCQIGERVAKFEVKELRSYHFVVRWHNQQPHPDRPSLQKEPCFQGFRGICFAVVRLLPSWTTLLEVERSNDPKPHLLAYRQPSTNIRNFHFRKSLLKGVCLPSGGSSTGFRDGQALIVGNHNWGDASWPPHPPIPRELQYVAQRPPF